MPNTDSWVDLDDDAFEAALQNEESVESEEVTEEPQEEALDDSTEGTEEDFTDDEESSEEVSEEVLDEDSTDGEADEEVEEETTDEPEEDEEDELDADESDDTDSETKAQLEELFKPFKASGREVQVKTIEEAKKLMSMGVDYSNKLQGFKAHRKTIKMLENNEIDEAKLNYFIDLTKGNPDAIKQLLKEHKVDPEELDLEEDSSYKPGDYSVSDSAVELDDVISRIQDTPSFSTTSDIITNQWDAASKQQLFKEPRLMENLNAQVANGTYDRVMQEVTRAKLFGGLQGLSDLEAYDQVGRTLEQQGAFQQQESAAVPTKVVETKPTQKVNTNKDRKLRASSSKPTRKVKAAPTNWAAMSDAEFEKLLNGD